MSTSDIVRIAQEISPEVAELLMRAFGGGTVYVPAVPRPEHVLSKAVGFENARAIARLLGPGRLEVPNGVRAAHNEKAARIVAMSKAGLSEREIAAKVGVTTRTVRRRRRQMHA